MARTATNTVEYFPHIAKDGKTLFILEGQYGNDGYAVWFKLLSILALSENHFYDASDETNWQYLVAKCRCNEITVTEILSLLANLGNIDKKLWENDKIIWCQAFVDNISDVYAKRKRPLPNKPKTHNCDRNIINCDRKQNIDDIPVTEKRQSKVNKSKVNKKEYSPDFEIFWTTIIHRPDDRKADAWKHWQKLKDIPPINTLLAAVKKYNKSKENQDKQFLISTFRWIENRMWEQNSELPGNGKSKPESWSIADWKFYTDVERTGSIGNQEQYDRYLKLDRELKQIRKSDDGINL